MADEDVPLDAPPPYTTGETVTVPYADSLATAAITMARADIRQRARQYSCADPMMEVIERFARVLFIVILIMYALSTIAVMVRVNTKDTISQYYDDNDDYDDYERTFNILPVLITIMLVISLSCTVGALLCDIPAMIAHFITKKVMNSVIFRTLDIIKWIAVTIGYIFTFIWIELFIETAEGYTPRPAIITNLTLCCMIIVMGVTIAVWDCKHLCVTRTTARSSQVVTMVPANSVAITVV